MEWNVDTLGPIVAIVGALVAIVVALVAACASIVSAIYIAFRAVFRLEQIEKWIEGHQSCSDQQIAILTEVREKLAFLTGVNSGEHEK